MSSHHAVEPQQYQLEAPAQVGTRAAAATPALANGVDPANGQNGHRASFYDQQTGQVVTASPVTEENLGDYQALQRQAAGASVLAGPPATVGDWVVTHPNGAAPLVAEVVLRADFLLRYAPADDHARAVLRWLAQTAGAAGAGDPAVASAQARLAALRASALANGPRGSA